MSPATASAAEVTGMDGGPPLRTSFTPRSARGYASGKDDYLARLRKVEGQVRSL